MKTLLQDIRFAARLLVRRPGFTAVAVLSLALGIGANAAIFSVVYAVLLRPLPYFQPDRLVRLYETAPQLDHTNVAPPTLRDWREQGNVFAGLASYVPIHPNLQGVTSTERIRATLASANLFSVLGAKPLLGRAFVAGEDQPGAPRVAVLGEDFWRSRFNSDASVLGKTITLDGDAYTVVGVMSARFRFPANEVNDVWAPQQINPQLVKQRSSHWLRVVARLRPGVQLATARSEMRQIADRLARQYPDQQRDRGVLAVPLRQDITGDIRPALLVLLGAAGLVLLIACANVANLLLARATDRRKEVAIRVALGARRSRLIRQLLTESILLALAGAVVGLALSYWGTATLLRLAGSSIPLISDVGFDPAVFTFLAVVAVLTGIVCGLVPALRATRVDLTSDLKEGVSNGSDGISRERLRSLLIVSETALALVLLVSAGLLMRAFLNLRDTNSGMVTENVLTMHIAASEQKYDTSESILFYQPVLQRIRAIPGVRAAGLTSALPLQESYNYGYLRIEGRTQTPGEEPVAQQRIVSPGYFRALGIPVLRGRAFTERDAGAAYNSGFHPAAGTAPAVVLINHALAKQYFPNQNPIGQRIKLGDSLFAPIVGITGDVRESQLEVPSAPTLYLSFMQFPQHEMTLVVSTTVPPTSVVPAIRAAIRSTDPAQPVYGVETMDHVVAESVSSNRFDFWLLGTFAAIALVLAAAGIYGVMSYVVTQRTREIGIRMALGAQATAVHRLLVREGMALVVGGLVLGALAALGVTRLLSSLLYGVSSTDPITFICVVGLLSIIAFVASYVPARRAAAVDPTISLRYE
jgi:putative ABC transport system permease protein